MALGKPRLAGRTPGDEDLNVLAVEGEHDKLIKMFRNPRVKNERFIIARVGVDEIVVREGGDEIAKLSLRHVEFATEEELLAAYTLRTSRTTLPGDDAPNQLEGLRTGGGSTADDDAAFDAAAPSS